LARAISGSDCDGYGNNYGSKIAKRYVFPLVSKLAWKAWLRTSRYSERAFVARTTVHTEGKSWYNYNFCTRRLFHFHRM